MIIKNLICILLPNFFFTQFFQPICLWSEPADESLIVNYTGVVVGMKIINLATLYHYFYQKMLK